ncbi:MAG TPA: hypothetical protein V6D02_07735 [Candidatus Obscuribacterales bacterium]
MKRGLLLGLLTLVCWLGLTLATAAQTNLTRLESRVDRLESELSRVRSQITRLEAQGSGRSIPPPAADSGLLDDLSLEEQFDNLATLAIELKQTVRQLEARVTQLEQSSPAGSP